MAGLCNADDKTPIIGGIKVTRDQYTDKDPYSALVQALASAAHIVTPAQYGRLIHNYKRRLRSNERRVDVYVITGSYNTKLTHMADLLGQAQLLASRLLEREEIAKYVRRVEFLDASPLVAEQNSAATAGDRDWGSKTLSPSLRQPAVLLLKPVSGCVVRSTRISLVARPSASADDRDAEQPLRPTTEPPRMVARRGLEVGMGRG